MYVRSLCHQSSITPCDDRATNTCLHLLRLRAMLTMNEGSLGIVRPGALTRRGIFFNTFIEFYISYLLISKLLDVKWFS